MKTNVLDIDSDRLDEEWISQPTLYGEWAEKLADAKRDMDVTKGQLEVTEAELSRNIRLNPADYSIEKITEPVVAATILMQKKYKLVFTAFIEAKHNVAIVQAMVDALDHKKKALESLCYLWGANYFSTPREPQNGEVRDTIRETKRDKAFGKKRREEK